MKSRRSLLRSTAGVRGASFWADDLLDAHPQNVNTNSKPCDLKITDLRVATIARAPRPMNGLWYGLVSITRHREIPGASYTSKIIVKPCAGKLHARFERGF